MADGRKEHRSKSNQRPRKWAGDAAELPASGGGLAGAARGGEAALPEQFRLVRSAVDQGFSAVLIASADAPDPLILYVNPAFAKVTGCTLAEVVGQPLSTLASLAPVRERLTAGLPRDGQLIEGLLSFHAPQGEHWGEWRAGPVRDPAGRLTHWLIILQDVTEHKRLEKEILEISDRERQRLGQDLHDGLCQHLAGIELMSQALAQRLAGRSPADATRAGEIAAHVREAIGQTRSLARGLAPVTLQSAGLASALEELATNTEKFFRVGCRLEGVRPAPALDAAAAVHCYRIVQEAVSNAIKHGQARQILIRLAPFERGLCLVVEDDGRGFPPEILEAGSRPAPVRAQGMGLRIMQYRASMIGGSLALERSAAGGARVVCSAPALTL